MSPVVAIGFWAALFVGSHFALSSDPIRPRLSALAGEQPFRGIYSPAALETFIPLALTFAQHKHADEDSSIAGQQCAHVEPSQAQCAP
jgi:hypothetical protein